MGTTNNQAFSAQSDSEIPIFSVSSARGSAWCQEEDEGEGGRRRGGRTRGRRRRWRRIGVSRRRGVWRGRGKRGRGKRGRGGEGGERERAREVRDERVSELFWLSCCCCLLPQSSAVIMAASGTLRRPTASFGLSCRDPEQPRFVAFATLFDSLSHRLAASF